MFLFVIVFLTFSFADKDPAFNPDVTFQQYQGKTCTGGFSLGAQGAVGVDDCIYNCWVNPSCTWATYASMGDYGQCNWGQGTCTLQDNDGIVAAPRVRSNELLVYYWGNGGFQKHVLFEEDMNLSDALQTCTATTNCTSFMFNNPTHAPADVETVHVLFLDQKVLIDSDALSQEWIYYKNATLMPYCDAIIDPVFAAQKVANTITVSWSHCVSGPGNNIQIQLLDGNGLPAGDPVSIIRESGSKKITTPASLQTGQVWSVELKTKENHILLSRTDITVVDYICTKDGVWDAQISDETTTLNCWDVNANYTQGIGKRHCTTRGWEEPNLNDCRQGGFSDVQVQFLNTIQHDMFYPDAFNQAHWPYYAWALFYWPGNKIYGSNMGDMTGDCQANGAEDIPGNMVDSPFRRMMGWWGLKAIDGECNGFTQAWLTSITTFYNLRPNKQWINDWFNITRVGDETSGDYTVKAQNATGNLRLSYSVETYHEFPVLNLMIMDEVEYQCFKSFQGVCGQFFQKGNSTACYECALENVATYQTLCAKEEDNDKEVVHYWCECDNKFDCGGAYPQ